MSWSDTALAAESLVMLAAARLLVVTAPAKDLVSRMGGTPISAPDPASRSGAVSDATGIPPAGADEPQASSPGALAAAPIGIMLERVARITWWRSMCLEKALAARWMLRRRGVAGTIYVGMARQGNGFVAHAWLVGEGRTLIGAGDRLYAALAAFREPGA